MVYSYEVKDGDELIGRGTLVASNELSVRKKVAERVGQHKFTRGLRVKIFSKRGKIIVDLDLRKSEIFSGPIAKRLQTMPPRLI